MSDAYTGEIRLFAGQYEPDDWVFCDGRLLNISQYQVLFSLLGTTWGGDGATTFGVPDLRGRIPIGQGQCTTTTPPLTNRPFGSKGGAESVILTTATMPPHTHLVAATTATADSPDPTGRLMASAPATNGYYIPSGSDNPAAVSTANPSTVTASGSGQAHPNTMPTFPLNYIICLNGFYPTRQ